MYKKITYYSLFIFTSVFLTAQDNFQLDFFVRGTGPNAANASENPIIGALDQLTNTKTNFIWLKDPDFSNTLAIDIANNTLPMVVAADKNAVILKGIEEGKFWDIGPYINDYPNLKKINPIIIENSKVNGVLYGLPKTRPLGRNAIIYRQDWFDALGLEKLETIEDFKIMLEAFTYGDPDGNGKDDTYGMTLTTYRGSLEEIAVWFGAPSSWGVDSKGDLIPAFLTNEYKDSIKFLRECYAAGLINQDFPIFNPVNWNKEIIEGRSGSIVDIGGRSRGITRSTDIIMNIKGAVEGPKGYRVLATNGFKGLIFFSKSGITSEAMLKKVLSYMDKLNSDEGRDLMLLGIEGKDWKKDGSNLVKLDYEGKIPPDKDIAQILVFPSAPSSLKPVVVDPNSKIRSSGEVELDNENYLVTNPAIGYTSKMQNQRGALLQDLIDDARIRYIMGLIDDNGYDLIVKKWREFGGDTVINEINEIYHQ